jgi:hypothetical protein
MEKVIVYTQTLNPRVIVGALANLEIRTVAGRAELAEALVRESDVLCVIVQVTQVDREFEAFLASLKRSMTRLNVGVVCVSCREAVPEVFTFISESGDASMLVRDLQNFAFSAAITNRRRANRFDWPLEGYLSLDDTRWQPHRVRSLSCNGAFLESDDAPAEPGRRGKLRIVFQDFKMLTTCEVLDSRGASSNLPPGFGVRFVDFSPPSRSVIDRIVGDALVRTLLHPDQEPGTPTIGDETLSMGPEIR